MPLSLSNLSISDMKNCRPPSLSPVSSSPIITHAPRAQASNALRARIAARSGSYIIDAAITTFLFDEEVDIGRGTSENKSRMNVLRLPGFTTIVSSSSSLFLPFWASFCCFSSCPCLKFCVSRHPALHSCRTVNEMSEATTRAPISPATIETRPTPHPSSNISYPSKLPILTRKFEMAIELGQSLPPKGLSLLGSSHQSTSSTSTVHTWRGLFGSGRSIMWLILRTFDGSRILSILTTSSSTTPSFFGLPRPPTRFLFFFVFFAYNIPTSNIVKVWRWLMGVNTNASEE
mmetsp:Transcript_45639/g.46097  ORF Transcript_45639/g.46097 Transcript_45639/m.46097 type:complete len:289 (-) Transcript_45639:33-899(-)